jgi:signal transduction histidine kinase
MIGGGFRACQPGPKGACSSPMRPSRAPALHHLADQVLESTEGKDLNSLLTQTLPSLVGVETVLFLRWDRRLQSFEGLEGGDTPAAHVLALGGEGVPSPETRYLLSDGTLLETSGRGEGTLVPLVARSGLVGMLVLGRPLNRHRPPLRPAEARALWSVAVRAALALENTLYQRELVATERMAALGTFAGMLAHDFRGPMTVIRGYAEMLLDTSLPRGEVAERAQRILKSVDRLQAMTEETLDFVRGDALLTRRPIAVRTFLEELAPSLENELPGLRLDVTLELPSDVWCAIDADKIRRAVGNIASNARDAMGGAGRLHLMARIEDQARLVILLTDEGPGVAESVRARVFEPFATHGKKRGTGLGLAVTRRFVEEHGGGVSLLPGPHPEGRGACFRIELPLSCGGPSARSENC